MNNRKSTKPVLAALLLVLGLLLFVTLPAYAANGVTLRAGSETGVVGDVVAVDIDISNAAGTMGGYFDLFYLLAGGPVKLELVNVTEGEFVSAAADSQFAYDDSGGYVTLSWETPATDTADSGVICTLTFRLLAEGVVDLFFGDDYEVEAPPGRIVAQPVSGRVTVTAAADDKQLAIDLANEAIAALPHVSMLRLEDKPDVENARYLVSRAKTEHEAVDADFENLNWLVAAENRIRELEEEPDPDDRQHAIDLANEAIAALPLIGDLELRHKPDVENARYLVSRAKTEHGAIDADFDNLRKLVAAEERIMELEAEVDPEEKLAAIRVADEAIASLPPVDRLILADKPDVEDARYLVVRAKHEHGAIDTDFENLEKLVAAEERIKELEAEERGGVSWLYWLLGALAVVVIVVVVVLLSGRNRKKQRQLKREYQ